MKKMTLALALVATSVLSVAAVGCSTEDSTESLQDPTRDPNAREVSRNPENTGSNFDHMNGSDGENANADNVQQKVENDNKVGGADVAARLHACGKLQYTAFGAFLRSRGVAQLAPYNGAGASLGVANYTGRIPEASFPSAAAFAKQFDVLAVASQEIITNMRNSTACPGTDLLSADGKTFNKDGISCLIGVPATDAHVAIANQVIAENPTDGARIAVSTLLSQAWACQ
jgi:hypothetical protein